MSDLESTVRVNIRKAITRIPRRSLVGRKGSMSNPFRLVGRDANDRPYSVILSSRPCAICGEVIGPEDFRRQQAIFAGDAEAHEVAHSHHFFTEDGEEVENYGENMRMLAAKLAETLTKKAKS